jgi:hypothetical protein
VTRLWKGVTAGVGSSLVVAHFAPSSRFAAIEEAGAVWFGILAGIALVLGGANIVRFHLGRIEARARGWGYSWITLGGFAITLAAGLFKLGAVSFGAPVLDDGTWFRAIHDGAYEPLETSVAALLLVSVAAAAHRAAARSGAAATAFVLAAWLTLVGELAGWVTGLLVGDGRAHAAVHAVARASDRLLAISGVAGQRALTIGGGLAIATLCLRIIAGDAASGAAAAESGARAMGLEARPNPGDGVGEARIGRAP